MILKALARGLLLGAALGAAAAVPVRELFTVSVSK